MLPMFLSRVFGSLMFANSFFHLRPTLLLNSSDSLHWWESQIGMCNYANVPIGNMTTDFPILISDILFARYPCLLPIRFKSGLDLSPCIIKHAQEGQPGHVGSRM